MDGPVIACQGPSSSSSPESRDLPFVPPFFIHSLAPPSARLFILVVHARSLGGNPEEQVQFPSSCFPWWDPELTEYRRQIQHNSQGLEAASLAVVSIHFPFLTEAATLHLHLHPHLPAEPASTKASRDFTTQHSLFCGYFAGLLSRIWYSRLLFFFFCEATLLFPFCPLVVPGWSLSRFLASKFQPPQGFVCGSFLFLVYSLF